MTTTLPARNTSHLRGVPNELTDEFLARAAEYIHGRTPTLADTARALRNIEAAMTTSPVSMPATGDFPAVSSAAIDPLTAPIEAILGR